MELGLGVSGTAVTVQRAVSAGNSRLPQKRSTRPDSAAQNTAEEVPVGSNLMDHGFDDITLENMCRLQYARWNNLEEYVAGVGREPDMWPSGLIKSTKKKGDDCKFYWKKVPEWRHMWGKASMMKA